MNFKELVNFIKIVELGSLSKAAQALNMAQPALGLQVRNLELHFKRQLLVRHSRGGEPTEAGRVLLHHARLVIDEMESARRLIAELGDASGCVSLGMTASANSLLLADLYALCREIHPGLTLDVVEGLSGQLSKMLLNNEIDLACLYSSVPIKGLSVDQVLEDEWVFVSSGRSSPSFETIRFRDIAEFPLVLPSRSSGMRLRLEEEARERDIELRIVLEVQSEALMKQLIEQGVGHTVLPFVAVQASCEKGELHSARIVEPVFPSRMFLARREKQTLNRNAAAVRSLLLKLTHKFGAMAVAASDQDLPSPTLREGRREKPSVMGTGV